MGNFGHTCTVQNAWRVGAGVVVVVTLGVVLRAETMGGAVLAVVAGLLMVQIPLDVRTHHLSRRATMIAAALVSTVIVFDVVDDGIGVRSAVLAFGVAAVVIAVYGLLHRHSPRSLGWGDVLLVAPLTLAVAYVAIERVLWWQLMASTTGAVHAMWVRVRSGGNHVPLGPHLLGAAWLVLVLSV